MTFSYISTTENNNKKKGCDYIPTLKNTFDSVS